jgi:hypothetical protein
MTASATFPMEMIEFDVTAAIQRAWAASRQIRQYINMSRFQGNIFSHLDVLSELVLVMPWQYNSALIASLTSIELTAASFSRSDAELEA